MQKLSTPFKVGLVIIIGIVVAIVMIIRFSANWGQDEGTIQLYAYFDDATGLAKKSLVKVAGIQVGEVDSITLEGTKALVRFKVRKDVPLYEGILSEDNYHRNGATVAKKLSGILGDYHLELTPGIEGRQLANGDPIPNVISNGGAEALLNDAEKILKDVSDVTNTLASVLGTSDGERNIQEILENLNATTQGLKQITNENNEKFDRIVTYVEEITANAAELAATGNKELPEIAKDADAMIEDLRATISSLRSGVNDTLDTTSDGIQQLRESIDKLDHTLASLESIAKNVENGEGTVGKLFNDDAIANEAQSLLSETRELIQKGSETVDGANSLLSPISKLDVDVSLRGDYLVRANAFKIDFGVKLQPSFDKYYLIGLVSDPHGKTTTKSILTDSSVSGPVYENITTNEDSVKFNLQYARRWRWFAGRFGIIENTGGLGGDVFLFDDDLQAHFDLFAFNDNKYPRLRGSLFAYLSLAVPYDWAKTFYIAAGFDDPINTKVFDYYFSVGFRFSDNDLKSMMSIVPTPNL